MEFTKFLAAAALGAIALPPLHAQSELIGLANAGGFSPVIQQFDLNTCRVTQRCTPTAFPLLPNPDAGGTAYDALNSGVWVSNGNSLARVDPDTCAYQCPPTVYPGSTAGSYVTGLAFRERGSLLYVLENNGWLVRFETDDCQLRPVDRCQLTSILPVVTNYGGLAVAELTGDVYVSATVAPGANQILIFGPDAQCQPRCVARVDACPGAAPLGMISGLAYDPCDDRLIITDGRQVISARVRHTGIGVCELTDYRCCTSQLSITQFTGLCIRPFGPTSTGDSCTNLACDNCPNMRQVMVGDPTVGNPGLRFDLVDAPRDSLAFFALGVGPCLGGAPIFPPFCGPFLIPWTPVPPIFVGPFPTGPGTGSGCTGRAEVHVPVPPQIGLCGDPFATQFLLLCRNNGQFGTGVSNCLSWELSGT